jgi:hypothetical protein
MMQLRTQCGRSEGPSYFVPEKFSLDFCAAIAHALSSAMRFDRRIRRL